MYLVRIASPKPNQTGPARILYRAGVFLIFAFAGTFCALAQNQTNAFSLAESNSIWSAGVGQGFRRGAQDFDFSGGAGFGLTVFGGREVHDWWLTAAQYGYVLTDTLGQDHFYRGNLELMGQAFAGEQYRPNHAYLVGVGPMLRYDFATGTPVIPFSDISAGMTATSIRNGDLSTTYEFNLQAGAGAHVFLTDHLSLTTQCRFIHLSNASTHKPNLGVNNVTFLLGATWFF
jgi:hypothetical protein